MYALQCMSCARYYNIIHNTNNRVSLRLVQYWQCDQLKMKCSSSLTLSLKSFSSSSLFCSASLHRSTTSPQSFSSSHLRNFFYASSNLFSRTSATAAPPTPPDTIVLFLPQSMPQLTTLLAQMRTQQEELQHQHPSTP